jgi:hypothetical protein
MTTAPHNEHDTTLERVLFVAFQVLLLAMPREELGRMPMDDTVILVVPQHARVAGYR